MNHRRNLRDTEFTGKHLRDLPLGAGNPGAAPPIFSWRTGLVVASLVLLVVAVGTLAH